jgi:hypothetical protein
MLLFLESNANGGHCEAHQVIIKAADGLTVSFCIKFQFSSVDSVVWLLRCAGWACCCMQHVNERVLSVSWGADTRRRGNRNGGLSRWCSVVKTRSRSKYMHSKLQAWRGDSILRCDVSATDNLGNALTLSSQRARVNASTSLNKLPQRLSLNSWWWWRLLRGKNSSSL